MKFTDETNPDFLSGPFLRTRYGTVHSAEFGNIQINEIIKTVELRGLHNIQSVAVLATGSSELPQISRHGFGLIR
jgi:hypothetical protein